MCSRKYPRDYQEATLFNLGGYPLYRRRRLQNGEAEARTTGRPYEQTNRWIVPYNPYLLLRYDCHINVEVCTSIKAVKYLYKYVHKGPDRANIEMGVVDEIAAHLDARYVAAPEATWRIFRYPLHDQSHSVVRLPVHLPREQVIQFEVGREAEAYRDALAKRTKLEAYFDLNRLRYLQGPGGSDASKGPLLYQDVPLHYIWRDGAWHERQRSGFTDRVIGRVYAASAKEGERYYLRVLLQHICDATRFEDLKLRRGPDLIPVVPKQCHDSFQQAALALGLLDDGTLARETLDEAVSVTAVSAAHLRRIFVMVLEWLPVPDPAALYAEYKEELCADHGRAGLPLERAADRALHDIYSLLRERGLPAESFNLPPPPDDQKRDWGVLEMERELAYDPEHEQQEFERVFALIKACPEQLAAWNVIQDALHGGTSNVVFIDGPAGSGKTTLYEALLHHQRAKGEIALAHAMLGIAALLLPGGRTTHSRYKLPVPLPLQDASCGIKPTSPAGRLLYRASVSIWDEAPNAPLAAIEAVDRFYRDLTGVHDRPFGGKPIILGGDFRQIPPVLRRINPESTRSHTLHAASFWQSPCVAKVSLKGNRRAASDTGYAEFLQRLGDGVYIGTQGSLPAALHPASIRLPEQLVDPSMDKEGLLHWVYPNPPQRMADEVAAASYYAGRAVVTPTNADADNLNSTMLGKLDTPVSVCLSRDEVLDATAEERDQFPEDFLNGTTVSGMPPHRLELRPGALGICLRNIAPDLGVCNGTRFVVVKVHKFLAEVALVTPPYTGRVVFLPRVCCDSSAEGELPFTLRRRQFPMRLAWVMTINKSQGQSIKERLGVYLPRAVFAHGQAYVAYSRGSGFKTVRTVVEQEEGMQGAFVGADGIPDGTYTLNIVDRSLLTTAGENTKSGSAALPMLVESSTATAGDGQELGDEFQLCAASCCPGGIAPQTRLEEYVESGSKESCIPDFALAAQSEPTLAAVGEAASGSNAGFSSTASTAECSRCGRSGHVAEQCQGFRQPPLRHADATSRGIGPHMRQVDTERILAMVVRGKASGVENNCLIDSLRQLVKPTAKTAEIRRALQLQFRNGAAKVTARNYLQVDFHAPAILRHMGVDPEHVTVTCIDLVHKGHGDVVGTGARQLYLARRGQNHFVPLFCKAFH